MQMVFRRLPPESRWIDRREWGRAAGDGEGDGWARQGLEREEVRRWMVSTVLNISFFLFL